MNCLSGPGEVTYPYYGVHLSPTGTMALILIMQSSCHCISLHICFVDILVLQRSINHQFLPIFWFTTSPIFPSSVTERGHFLTFTCCLYWLSGCPSTLYVGPASIKSEDNTTAFLLKCSEDSKKSSKRTSYFIISTIISSLAAL